MTKLSKSEQEVFIQKFIYLCGSGDLNGIIDEISNEEKKSVLIKKENQIFILNGLELASIKNKKDFILQFFLNNKTKQLIDNLKQDEIFINLCKNKWVNLLNILIDNNIIEIDTIKNIKAEFIESYFEISYNKRDLNMFKLFLNNENIRNKIKDEKIISFFSEELMNYRNIEFINILYNNDCIKNNNKFLGEIFYNICGFDFIKSFEIIIDNSEILNKIINLDKKIIEDCFKVICNNGSAKILELFLNKREIMDKIKEDNFMPGIIKRCFLTACTRADKKDVEIVKKLIDNEEILNEVISILNHNPNILKEKFEIACNRQNVALIKIFINNDRIRENIGENTIKHLFELACSSNKLNVIKEFTENKNTTNLFPNDYLKKLINDITIKTEEDLRLSILLFKEYMLNNNNILVENKEYDNIKNKINDFSKKNKTYKSLNKVFNNIKDNPQRNLLIFMELEKELNNINLINPIEKEEQITINPRDANKVKFLPPKEEWIFV